MGHTDGYKRVPIFLREKNEYKDILCMCGRMTTYPLNTLALKNAHPRDANIQFFEKNHQYVIYGKDSNYTSVTTLLHHTLFEKFDKDLAVKKAANGTNPKYKNMDESEILQLWEDARNNGTALHLKCEQFYNQVLPSSYGPATNASLMKYYKKLHGSGENTTKEWNYFMNFVKDYPHLKPYRTEQTVFHEEIRICGSIDISFENPDGSLSVYDWKRTDNISSDCCNFGRYSLLECLAHIPDIKYWQYAIQLNLYKYILEAKYGKIVKELFIVQLYPDNNNYVLLQMPILTDEMADLANYLMKRQP